MIAQHSKCSGFLRDAAEIAPFLLLIGFVPGLAAQQYCVSGAVTSVSFCTGCIFNVGDPVAMTFSVQPSSITCYGSGRCLANAAFSADIGARHWTSQNDQNPNDAGVEFDVFMFGATTTSITMQGNGTLSPLPSPPPADGSMLLGGFSLSGFPGNLLSSGTLPAGLPSPDAVAPSNATLAFQAIDGFATAHVSYKGQTCATGSPQASPTINSLVNDASFTAGSAISTGSWAAIFGTGLAPVGDSRTWNAATEIVNGKLPVSLDGTSVTVNGKPAAVEFIQPSQVNIQTPDDTAVGPVQVVVHTAGGASNSFTVNYATFAPGLFPATAPYIVAQHADNSYVTATTPAKPGEVIILWGTGFGPANPPVPAGQVFSGANPLANTVSVAIGGQPAAVDFAGVVGAGLVQINVHVPPGINNGDTGVVATVGTVSTQTTANMISIHN